MLLARCTEEWAHHIWFMYSQHQESSVPTKLIQFPLTSEICVLGEPITLLCLPTIMSTLSCLVEKWTVLNCNAPDASIISPRFQLQIDTHTYYSIHQCPCKLTKCIAVLCSVSIEFFLPIPNTMVVWGWKFTFFWPDCVRINVIVLTRHFWMLFYCLPTPKSSLLCVAPLW